MDGMVDGLGVSRRTVEAMFGAEERRDLRPGRYECFCGANQVRQHRRRVRYQPDTAAAQPVGFFLYETLQSGADHR
jgi:hypothetical protein